MEEMVSESSLEEVELILGYKFKDKNLLLQAFTHVSFHDSDKYSEKHSSYERLELMGDSVLNLLMIRKLFFLYPKLSPGKLTYLRSDNTDNEKLARVAFKQGLHRFLRHKKPHLEQRIQEFEKAMVDYPLHSHRLIRAPKILADVLEAAIGAVFIDSNSIETVWKVFEDVLEPFISLEKLGENPVTTLLEICQKNGCKPRYDTDSWDKDQTAKVYVKDCLVGKATFGKKDIAINRAAKDALDNIDQTYLVFSMQEKDQKSSNEVLSEEENNEDS
ncbi:ribonuclease 3-like protein 3 [Quercus suber]|uniref:ribonuclease 3-like protein 3 n=1 Tax=Quercus suber TaxID=58331 RepID=UPI000CE1DEFF|nr:ribonuclease 3-like protein 3 [Quercus suber]